MIGEAVKRGVRFSPLAVATTDVKVSPYGRIYNARAGLGAYYRYEPRRLDPPRDRQGACIPHPKVHESVIWRIAMGTDAYAPLSLPNGVRVVTESRAARTDGQPRAPNILTFEDYRAAVCAEGDLFGAPAGKNADAERRKRAAEDFAALSMPDDRTLELLWDTVWWRRIAYLATLISSALFVLFPFLPSTGIDWEFVFFPLFLVFPIYSDTEVTWYVSSVESAAAIVRSFLPAMAGTWIDAFQKFPFSFLTLLATTIGFFLFGALLDRRIHDRALAAWSGKTAIAGSATASSTDSRRRASSRAAGCCFYFSHARSS